MKLYFLRHGEADWENWERSDDERPLNKKGRKEMRAVAAFLAEHKIKPDAILTSPLPRASQTAELAALALDQKVIEEPSLAPGFDLNKLAPLLQKYANQDLMLVGHEPDFSSVIGALTSAHLKLPKAGLARVDLGDPNVMHGQLRWLIPPKISGK